jgi:hypothetical protein
MNILPIDPVILSEVADHEVTDATQSKDLMFAYGSKVLRWNFHLTMRLANN